jgi:hypothetical protein
MNIPGRVRNGVVVPEGGASLPEGASVAIVYPVPSSESSSPRRKRVQFPLVRSAQPGSIDLTNDRIAEILNEEDAAPRR